MTYKKNWFGWLTFFLSAGLMSVLLFSFFTLLFSLVIKVDFITEYSYLFSAFSVLILYGFFFLLNFIKGKFSISHSDGIKLASSVFTVILFLAALGVGLYHSLSIIQALLSQNRVFEANDSYIAVIDAMIYGNAVPNCSTLTFTYCSVISFIFRVFGINLAYAGIFETCMLFAGSVMLFFSVLNLYGKTPAIICYGYITAVYPVINSSYLKGMDSFNLLYFLSTFVFFAFSAVLKARYKNEMKSNSNLLLFFLTGALLGLIIYLDLSMSFLFVGGIVIICSIKIEDTNLEKAVNRRALPLICYLAGGLLISCGSFVLDTVLSGGSVKEQIFLLGSRFYLINVINVLLPTEFLNECIVILAFCLFACLSFLVSKDVDRYGSLFISFIVFVCLSAFSLVSVNVSMLSVIFYGILVGCGLQELLFNNYTESGVSAFGELILLGEPDSDGLKPEDVKSESTVSSESEASNAAATNSDGEQLKDGCDNVSDDGSQANIQPETDSASSENSSVITVHVLMQEDPEKETVNQPAFDKSAMIENPLPLPKKHEKKRIDFPMEPSSDKMKYDIQIKEDDDFDV